MKDQIILKCHVDTDRLNKVEEESYQILLQQRYKFNNRWYDSSIFLKLASLLRLTGIFFSLLGIFLCVFYLAYPSSCPKWFHAEIYLLAFIIFAVIFWYLPQVEEKIKAKLKTVGKGSCRKMAQRLVKKARKCTPYTAEYSINGNLVSYYRRINDQQQLVWNRRLKGFSIVNKHTLLFFRKPTSLVPIMLILLDNNEEAINILKQLELKYEEFN